MNKKDKEKNSILGIISVVIMVISTLPLYIGYLAKVSVEMQKNAVYVAAAGFLVSYLLALIDIIFGKKNKNFSVLTVVMETVIVIIITLAYTIL